MQYPAAGYEMTLMEKLEILTDAAKYDVGVIALGLIKKN